MSGMCLCWLCANNLLSTSWDIFFVQAVDLCNFLRMRALVGAGLCVFALVWGLLRLCWKLFERLQPNEIVTDLWVCEHAPVCFSGAGLGLLPFSVSPVTPTASTNCDTGTHSSTELYSLYSLSHNISCVLKKLFFLLISFSLCHCFPLVWVNWLSVWDVWELFTKGWHLKNIHTFLFSQYSTVANVLKLKNNRVRLFYLFTEKLFPFFCFFFVVEHLHWAFCLIFN